MTLKTQPFEAARFLEDDEAVAVFITSILEENNPALLAAALGEVAKARGMAQVAEKSGMAREALYKALRSDSQPRFETIARVKPGDVMIAISFPRYSNRTLECMQFAKSRGVKVIGITDGPLSPLNEVASLCLAARTDMTSFADSLAAPMSLINALIAALGNLKRETLNHNFAQMESVWDAYRVYAGKA